MNRREFVVSAGLGVVAAVFPMRAQTKEHTGMHGLIGKMTAAAGKRDELIAILLEGIHEMPGCLSYVVAKDPTNSDAIWITEVWDNKDSHQASLSLPAVKQAIARARPLIAGFEAHHVTEPVGGHGLATGK